MKDPFKLKGNNYLHSPLPKRRKRKNESKSQLLIFGIIHSPICFWTYMFLSNLWTAKYSSNTLTHKIIVKAWHSQTFIYSDFSSLGNTRDLFGWLNTVMVFPPDMDIYLPYFSMRYWLLCRKRIILGKFLSFPSRFHFLQSSDCKKFLRSGVYSSSIKAMMCVWLEYTQEKKISL